MLVLVFKREFFLSRLQNVLDTWQNQQNGMCVQRRLRSGWASEDWSDWADSQADLSLRWAHSFCWFCHGAAHFMSVIKAIKSIIYHVQRTKQYPKSTHCMLLFRLVLFAEPCLTILRWLEKRQELYWTTGDVPGRCLVVTTFEIVYCQLLFIPTCSMRFWHRELVYRNT